MCADVHPDLMLQSCNMYVILLRNIAFWLSYLMACEFFNK